MNGQHSWTNFEEHREFPTQFETDGKEEQQQGTKAKAAQAPKQPTPQEILEHTVTHLPYRSWCPICVQARGRQNNHPKPYSKLPIIQLDFGYIKGFDDSNVHPILTASDIQSGMIMAIQLTDKRSSHTATALPHRMWKNIRHHTTIRSGRLPDSAYHSSGQQDRQHHYKELRSIQFTITRRSRASAQNTVCANQNTQGTNQAELQQRHFNQTSTHALDSSTQCVHHEQVCSSQQWMHKLLQQMEQRAAHTTL